MDIFIFTIRIFNGLIDSQLLYKTNQTLTTQKIYELNTPNNKTDETREETKRHKKNVLNFEKFERTNTERV